MPIITTSGTTGKPKAVFVPPEIEAIRNSKMTDDERGTGFSKLKSIFIDFGESSVLGLRYKDFAEKNPNVRVIFTGRGSIEKNLQMFEEEQIEGITSTPSGLVNYANAAKADGYKFKWIMSTAFPLTGEMAKTIMPKLGTNLWSIYASSEAGIISLVTADQIIQNRFCVGKIYKDVEIQIIDGEIVIRSPAMIHEYVDNSELTAKRFRDGWCYSGDLGYIQDDLLYLTGRKL